MTITSTVNTFETTANVTDQNYTFNQPIHKATDLVVYVAGVVKETDDGTYPHTVTVAANKLSATVAFTSAPGVVALKFERVLEYKQETDLANNSLFDAESLETSLDNIVMQTQQAGIKADAAFGFDPGIAADNYNTTITAASILNKDKDARKGKTLIFHATTGDIDVSALSVDEVTASVATAAQSATDATNNGAAQVTLATAQVGLATTAKGAAVTAQLAAEAVFDNFDDRYLGTKSSDPTLDNDSNALVTGAIYYNTTNDYIKVYDSTTTPTWKQITTTVANQTNIDILTTKYDGSTSAGSGTNLNIAQVNTVALSVANVNNFADLYQIDDFTTVPTKDGGGVDVLVAGDLAYDTTGKALRVFNGTAWSSGVNTTDGVIVKQEYTGNASTTHFALVHDQGMEIVYLNGVKLLAGDGSSNNDFFSVSGGSSTTYVGDGNAATHIYFHTAPANTYVVSLVAWGASANTLAVSVAGGAFSGAVTFAAGLIANTVDINGGTLGAITIDGNWTAASQTCADLGTVTTANIDGGTVDGLATLGVGTAPVAFGNGNKVYIYGDATLASTQPGIVIIDAKSDTNARNWGFYNGASGSGELSLRTSLISHNSAPTSSQANPYGNTVALTITKNAAIVAITNAVTVGGTLGVTGATTLAALTATTVNSTYITSSADGYSHFIGSNLPTAAASAYNTAMGGYTMNALTTGKWNTCVGYSAGRYITEGLSNVIVGAYAGDAVTDGDYNVCVGREAGTKITTGIQNTAIGNEALVDNITGSNNICIGHNAGSISGGPGGEITGSNIVAIGNGSITNAHIQVAWTIASDERDKADVVSMTHGLDVIENINPINYVWDKRSSYSERESDGSKKQSDLRTGFSAQNVKVALDAVGYIGHSVINSEDEENLKITETNILPFLVNAIKELSAKVKALESA